MKLDDPLFIYVRNSLATFGLILILANLAFIVKLKLFLLRRDEQETKQEHAIPLTADVEKNKIIASPGPLRANQESNLNKTAHKKHETTKIEPCHEEMKKTKLVPVSMTDNVEAKPDKKAKGNTGPADCIPAPKPATVGVNKNKPTPITPAKIDGEDGPSKIREGDEGPHEPRTAKLTPTKPDAAPRSLVQSVKLPRAEKGYREEEIAEMEKFLEQPSVEE